MKISYHIVIYPRASQLSIRNISVSMYCCKIGPWAIFLYVILYMYRALSCYSPHKRRISSTPVTEYLISQIKMNIYSLIISVFSVSLCFLSGSNLMRYFTWIFACHLMVESDLTVTSCIAFRISDTHEDLCIKYKPF